MTPHGCPKTRELAIETHRTTYRTIAGSLREAGFRLSTFDVNQMSRNILSFILKHPIDFIRWESMTNGFATRRGLKYLLNHAPPDVMGGGESVLRIIYAEKNTLGGF